MLRLLHQCLPSANQKGVALGGMACRRVDTQHIGPVLHRQSDTVEHGYELSKQVLAPALELCLEGPGCRLDTLEHLYQLVAIGLGYVLVCRVVGYELYQLGPVIDEGPVDAVLQIGPECSDSGRCALYKTDDILEAALPLVRRGLQQVVDFLVGVGGVLASLGVVRLVQSGPIILVLEDVDNFTDYRIAPVAGLPVLLILLVLLGVRANGTLGSVTRTHTGTATSGGGIGIARSTTITVVSSSPAWHCYLPVIVQ